MLARSAGGECGAGARHFVLEAEVFDDNLEDEEEDIPEADDEVSANMRCVGTWERGEDGISARLSLHEPATESGTGVNFLPLRASDLAATTGPLVGTLRWEGGDTFLVFSIGGRKVLFSSPTDDFCPEDEEGEEGGDGPSLLLTGEGLK